MIGAPPSLLTPHQAAPTWREVLRFFVPGTPAPGGSKTARVISRGGKIVMANGRPLVTMRDAGGEKNKDWKRNVTFFAQDSYEGAPLDGTLRVEFTFYMPRCKGHYGTGKNEGTLKASAPAYHTTKPDVLKLARSTEDAMSGVIYIDDARIAEESMRKLYACAASNGRTGAEIRVSVLEGVSL